MEALEEFADADFTHVELSGNFDPLDYDQETALLRAKELGLQLIAHNYFPPPDVSFVLNIASADPLVRKNSLDMIRKAIDFSLACGRNHFGIHAGYAEELSAERDDADLFVGRQAIADPAVLQEKFLNDLLTTLPQGFRLSLENGFPHRDDSPVALFYSPEHIENFLERYENAPYGLLLDIGHLGVSAHKTGFDKFAALERLINRWSGRIFEIHLSTPDGGRDAHGITDPNSPEVTFLKEHKRQLKHAPLVMEWRDLDCREAFETYQQLQRILS